MIGQRQTMKMQQKLTPQQVMMLRLLHMPVHELMKAIDAEVEKNPLLEIDQLPMESLPSSDSNNNDDYDDYEFDTRTYSPHASNEQNDNWQLASEPSFSDMLRSQFDLKLLSPTDIAIGHEIIGSLDDSGYITRDLGIIANDIALYNDIDVMPDDVERVLKVVQSLDPPGIAARNLQECLSIQLHRLSPQSDDVRIASLIVDNAFDDFTQHRYNDLTSKLNINSNQLTAALSVIQRLNPKPGEAAGTSEAPAIIPDVILFVQDDNVDFFINDRHIPKLHIDQSYLSLLQSLSNSNTSKKELSSTQSFISSNADSAQLFIEALNLRHQTMEKVMRAIIKKQKRYFLSGEVSDLVPMMQKDIAEAVGLDISTISRMVNSKYLRTPFGTILLKDLFTSAVTTQSGDQVSSETVKQILRSSIDAEDKRHPLTDEQLTSILNTKGYPTARRTVAKYREALGIPVARLRRSLKVIAFLLLTTASMFASAQVEPTNTTASPQSPSPTRSEQLPATLWYGNNFSDSRVRLCELPLDSLPDEINIKLLRKGEQFVFPIKNPRTSPYGWRWERPHRGVDIGLRTGEPIHCAFDGVVRIAKPMGGYGNLVVVRHYNGLETVYGHLSKINVKPRQAVKAGDVLGLGGSTGHSTGPHLHFEVRFQYEAFDPEWLLDFSTYTLRTQKLHLDKSYFGIKKPRGRKGESIVYKADKSYIKEPERKGPREMFYVIKSGDDLADIAHRYSTTVEKIRSLNDGLAKKPKPGTKIRVR